MKPYSSLLIFGGSFDPIHNGHLQVAKQIHDLLPKAKFFFLPCYQSPLKGIPSATTTQRLDMLHLALQAFSELYIDPRELKKQGPSYTYQTLYEIQAENPGMTLYFLLGSEAFENFDCWDRWQDILNIAHLLIYPRNNFLRENANWNDNIKSLVKKHETRSIGSLFERENGLIYFANLNENSTSSTKIRERLYKNEELPSLLPESVYSYIKKHRLYSPHPTGG